MPPVLDLRDVNSFPALYAVTNRFDEGRLTEEGARLFSRLFAEEFKTWLEEQRAQE